MAMLGLEFSLRKIIAGFIIAVLVAFFFGFIAGYNATKETKSERPPKIDLSPSPKPSASPPKIDLR